MYPWLADYIVRKLIVTFHYDNVKYHDNITKSITTMIEFGAKYGLANIVDLVYNNNVDFTSKIRLIRLLLEKCQKSEEDKYISSSLYFYSKKSGMESGIGENEDYMKVMSILEVIIV